MTEPTPTKAQKLEAALARYVGTGIVVLAAGGLLVGIGSWFVNGISSENNRPLTGDAVAVQVGSWGCPGADGFDEAAKFYEQHDPPAADRSLEEHGCQIFSGGVDNGVLGDRSLTHATICVRAYGETSCTWFPYTAVSKTPPDGKN